MAVGSKRRRDPTMAFMDELNAQFADEDLKQQASANSEEQFLTSQTLKDSLLLAVYDTNQAHSRMTELFNQGGPVESAMLELLGKLVYRELRGAPVDTSPPPTGVDVHVETHEPADVEPGPEHS